MFLVILGCYGILNTLSDLCYYKYNENSSHHRAAAILLMYFKIRLTIYSIAIRSPCYPCLRISLRMPGQKVHPTGRRVNSLSG